MRKAIFITVEGLEGSGKSSVISFLEKYFRKKKFSVKVFRDPGSTRVGEKIRGILLGKKNNVSPYAELLLYLAARAQLIEEELLRAFKKYKVVICDRFYDSTVVYQGYGLGLGKIAERAAREFNLGVVPDITILLESDIKKSLKRIKKKDRIESRPYVFHKRLKEGFTEIARKHSRRIKVIPADAQLSEIYARIESAIDDFLKKWKRMKKS